MATKKVFIVDNTLGVIVTDPTVTDTEYAMAQLKMSWPGPRYTVTETPDQKLINAYFYYAQRG